ncbi:hypothetical protein [Micromonospora sp. NPDC003241]
MTTAEKITLAVSIATALGIGALLKSAFDHFLSRPEKRAAIAEKEVTIADKSVQIANTLMSRMESELERLQSTLAAAQEESGELRAELAEIRAASEVMAETTAAAVKVAEASAELDETLRTAQSIQHNVEGRLKQLTLYISHNMLDNGIDLDAATLAVLQAESIIDRPDDDDGGAVGAVPKPRR